MSQIFWISGFGVVGVLARFAVSNWVQVLVGRPFPLGTLLVNAAGCLLAGILFAVPTLNPPAWINPELKVAIAVGFLGGFTTFSAFSLESYAMLVSQRAIASGLAYLVLSPILGILCVWVGHEVGQRIFS